MTNDTIKFQHPTWAYDSNAVHRALGRIYDAHYDANRTPLRRATLNYKNAKAFLAQTNSIHALKRFRGAALKRCASCRRDLMDNILIAEMKL